MEGTSLARRVYLWTAWLFLASVVAQVFFIGLYLFAGYDLGLHFLGALVVTVMSIVVLISTFAAGVPGRSKRWAGALVLLTIVQGILPGFKETGLSVIAALHPVNALLLFWLGLVVLRDAQEQVRMPAPEATAKLRLLPPRPDPREPCLGSSKGGPGAPIGPLTRG
jgi:mercuric ion transport protein